MRRLLQRPYASLRLLRCGVVVPRGDGPRHLQRGVPRGDVRRGRVDVPEWHHSNLALRLCSHRRWWSGRRRVPVGFVESAPITVRAASIGQGLVGAFKSIGGGNIEEWAEVGEAARHDASTRMMGHP